MLKGLRLQVLIGPSIPAPMRQVWTDALENVEINVGEDETGHADETHFNLMFRVNKRVRPEEIFVLIDEDLLPYRVMLIAIMNGLPQVLADGLIVNHQLSPAKGDGTDAIMTLTCNDLSWPMSLLQRTGKSFDAMGVEDQVNQILKTYEAILRITPQVRPPPLHEVPSPNEKVPAQHGSDLDHIRWCADKVGYKFHILPAPTPGQNNIAYWGPRQISGRPQPALSIDVDAYTNVDSLNFEFEQSKTIQPVLYAQKEHSTEWQEVPPKDANEFNPPRGKKEPKVAQRNSPVGNTGGLSTIEVLQRGLAKTTRSMDCVAASGELDVRRYGQILQARSLVDVRGAGSAFDGRYYVRHVTHNIQRGEYKQTFNLVRFAVIADEPKVWV
jgi:hypothetical protein